MTEQLSLSLHYSVYCLYQHLSVSIIILFIVYTFNIFIPAIECNSFTEAGILFACSLQYPYTSTVLGIEEELNEEVKEAIC